MIKVNNKIYEASPGKIFLIDDKTISKMFICMKSEDLNRVKEMEYKDLISILK